MSDESNFVNEVRKDLLGRYVVITAGRSSRPHDPGHVVSKPQKTQSPQKCFFCPGNEHLTPPEIARLERQGKWEIRVFPNKFPAFSPESPGAYGRHEVIVESPDHQATLSELSEENLFDYLSVLCQRLQDSKKDSRLQYTSIFKNEGKAAGCSLEHTHTQLVGMPFVPPYVKRLAKKSKAFRKLAARKRLCWAQNEDFVALCPKTSRFHLGTWIIPREAETSIDLLPEKKLRSLASILKTALVAIDAAAEFPPYNIVFQNAPHSGGDFPFHLEILPRTSVWAGFELGTEVVMVSDVPEESVLLLRDFAKG